MKSSKTIINEYVKQSDWRVKENSTVQYSLGGLILSNSGNVTSDYWLSEVYDQEIGDAHRNADLHIHDLSMLSGYCFTGDTRVKTLDGKNPTFKELVDSGVKTLKVFSYDLANNKVVIADAVNPRVTRQTDELVRVTLATKQEILCTPDHLFLLRDGTYKQAKDLKPNDSVMALYITKEDGKYIGINKKSFNHRVRKVEHVFLTTPIDVYDLTVPGYENFAIGANIFVHNCAGWSLKQLIREGLGGVPGKITSAPASHLSTLCNQMVNFLGIMQNEWAGAQAFSSFDTYLAPFVRVDKLSYKEVKQCIQSFIYGVNTPSRWGTQAPFTNITLDWVVPADLAELPCIVGGKDMDFCYKDCKKEMDMVNKAFIEIMIEGDANGRGFQYPIPTYSITKDFDWSETENNKLLFEMTAKYGTPYFSNYINSDMEPSDVRSMCPLDAHTRVIVNIDNEMTILPIGMVFNNYKDTLINVWTGKGWAKGKPIRTPKTDVYDIWFSNDTHVKLGKNHLQPTVDFGTLHADELKVGMKLPFSDGDFEITSITKIDESDYNLAYLYCFEIDNADHLFELANGLITHNCRLRLDLRELRKKSGGFFGSGESTGSIGVVTINMPRIGYLAENETDFYKRLDLMMDIAARSLDIKRKAVTKWLEDGLYPYTKRYLGTFSNHFSTIATVGGNEMCLNAKWIREDLTHEKAQQFMKDVLNHMRNRLSDYQEMYGDLFNLEAAPAESTSYRLAKHDKERYPDIIVATSMNCGAPYYTNSSHLPVGYTEDVFSALDIQDELQTLYTSGTVFHAFLGEKLPDWRSAANLVRKIAENYKLPYYTMSPTYSVCSEHGYISGEAYTCPKCGKTTEVYSRITGYYRPVQNWNDGKLQEFKERKVYRPVETCCVAELRQAEEVVPSVETFEPAAEKKVTEFTITLVGTKTCPNCKIAASLLDKFGYPFTKLYVEDDRDFVTERNISSVPALVINSGDEERIITGVGTVLSAIKSGNFIV